jgi:cytoskeleton protein RodZ
VGAFGARLKRERERRGVTLDEIAMGTKIGTRFLHAIEEEHFELLPGGIFNKGFIRAYARHLGMDEEQAVTDYLAATGATAIKKLEGNDAATQPLPEKSSGSGANLPWGLFAVALLILALGFSIFGFYSREKLAKSQNSAPVKPASAAAEGQTAAVPTPIAAQPESVAVSSPGPSQRDVANATSPSTFAVSIKTTDECWIAITADGKEVLQDTLLEGAQETITAEKDIVIRAGNVGALDFEFNGEALPAQGEDGEVKTVVFDTHGLRSPVSQPERIAKPRP